MGQSQSNHEWNQFTEEIRNKNDFDHFKLNFDRIKFGRNKYGESILHNCCEYNRIEELDILLKYLLKNNIDLNIKSFSGDTALHLACLYNNIDCCYLLINSGADPSIKNNIGDSPFDAITLLPENKITLVKHLENLLYAKCNNSREVNNVSNMSRFSNCISEEDFRLAARDSKWDILFAYLMASRNVNAKDYYCGNTAFHYACQHNVNIAKVLIAFGADHQIRNDLGQTALGMGALKISDKEKLMHLIRQRIQGDIELSQRANMWNTLFSSIEYSRISNIDDEDLNLDSIKEHYKRCLSVNIFRNNNDGENDWKISLDSDFALDNIKIPLGNESKLKIDIIKILADNKNIVGYAMINLHSWFSYTKLDTPEEIQNHGKVALTIIQDLFMQFLDDSTSAKLSNNDDYKFLVYEVISDYMLSYDNKSMYRRLECATNELCKREKEHLDQSLPSILSIATLNSDRLFELLKDIKEGVSPYARMRHMVNFCNEVYQGYNNLGKYTGADDLLDTIVYCMRQDIVSTGSNWSSILKFVEAIIDVPTFGKEAYYILSFNSALQSIIN